LGEGRSQIASVSKTLAGVHQLDSVEGEGDLVVQRKVVKPPIEEMGGCKESLALIPLEKRFHHRMGKPNWGRAAART